MANYDREIRHKRGEMYQRHKVRALERKLVLLDRDDIEPDFAAREESALMTQPYVPRLPEIPTTLEELEDVLAELGATFRHSVTPEEFLPQNQARCRIEGCDNNFPRILGARVTDERCLPCYARTEYGIVVPEHSNGAMPALTRKTQVRGTKNPIIFNSYVVALIEAGLQAEPREHLDVEEGHLDDPLAERGHFEDGVRALEGDRH